MEKGCKFKDSCPAYLAKAIYGRSPVLSANFSQVCDTTPNETFVEGFCPMYDTHSRLYGLMEQLLREANDSLKKTSEGLSKRL